MEEHVYRMYSIVLKQLDGIHSGVQTAHGVCEYIRKHWGDKDLQQWMDTDKTLIILNGGSTSNMEYIMKEFERANVKFETFEEEDLGNLTTSICVLADERIWDRDFISMYDYRNNRLAQYRNEPLPNDFADKVESDYYEYIGGEENAMKKFILNELKTK